MSGAAEGGRTAHVPALDGLRGLAVAAVVAYHLGYAWATGGYLGVDTFLVLSGYLITTGLLTEHARTGTIRLRSFWDRRVRRLVPALLVLLVAVAIYAAVGALPDEARSLRLDGLSAIGFVSNWRFIVSSQGYFGQSSAPSLLRHTWSLGVEAQLYLLWPLIVMMVLGRWGRRGVRWVALGLAVASAAAASATVLVLGELTRAYYGTDTRASGFLVGAAVAALLAERGQEEPRAGRRCTDRVLVVAGGAALALTAVLWGTLPGSSAWLFRGGMVLAEGATAIVIWVSVSAPRGLIGRWLSVGPLALLGRVSYGVYLWHWPVVLYLNHRRTGRSGLDLLALRLLVTVVLTAASWVLVERPSLGRVRPRFRTLRPALIALATTAVSLALVASLLPTPATPLPRAVAAVSVRADAGLSAAGPVHAVVLGDSVAVTLERGMKPAAPGYGVALTDGGIVGCGVTLGALRTLGNVAQPIGPCPTWVQEWQQAIVSSRAAVAVILLGRWEMLDRMYQGRWQHLGDPAFDAYVARQLDAAITIASAGGRAVIVCTAPYYLGPEQPQGGVYPENEPSRVDRFNQLVRQSVRTHPGVIVFDLNRLVSPAGRFASVVDGRAVRAADGIHFSPAGGLWIAARLLPLVARAGRNASSQGAIG